MTYDPEKHHRRSIRLKEYDYTQAGAYFVTIVTQDRACLFGDVVDKEIRLNKAGQMVQGVWDELNRKFPIMKTDKYIVMPNHFHGILIIDCRGESCIRPDPSVGNHKEGDHKDRPYGTFPNTVGRIIQAFKSITTNQYIRGVKHQGWTRFHEKLWQRNYYEHVVRDDDELNRIREYIINNPAQWAMDRENPNATTPEPENGS